MCRYFRGLGAECDFVVGASDVVPAAAQFEPHIVISDSELLTSSLLDTWSHEAVLAGTPVLAVSLTRRPDEAGPPLPGVAGVIYLPALDRAQGLAILAGAYRPRGVDSPQAWRMPLTPAPPGVVR